MAAGALWTLDPVPQASKPVEDRPRFGRSIVEGFTAVRRYPLAASVIVVGIAWGLIGGGYDVLIGLYGVRLLRGGGGLAVGLLYVADGVGVLVGPSPHPACPLTISDAGTPSPTGSKVLCGLYSPSAMTSCKPSLRCCSCGWRAG